ncbi:MAG: hypothetical protein ACRCZI_05385 [Cetobacterium sp.]
MAPPRDVYESLQFILETQTRAQEILDRAKREAALDALVGEAQGRGQYEERESNPSQEEET